MPTPEALSPVLITGATGFVGVHTLNELLQSHYQVKVLVRPTSDLSRLPQNVEKVFGRLEDYTSLMQAAQGCKSVVHIAGLVRVKRGEGFYQVNEEGTRLLARVAQELGVQRFLLISSQAAGGPALRTRPHQVSDPDNPVTDYGRSKLAGELILRQGDWTFWWSILRPPAVYGPYDKAFLTLVRWVKWGVKLKLGDGTMPFSLIYAIDLARAIRLAFEWDGPSGQIWYVNDGVPHTLFDLTDAIEKALEKKAIWLTIPNWVAPIIAGFIEGLARLGKGSALLSRQKVVELSQPAWICDDTPFREATGFQPLYDLYRGMAETVRWYKEKGWI